MENQLQKSSVKNLLQEEGIQHATGRVRSASLQEEMSLVGFVPYSLSNLYLQLAMYMDLNDGLIVTPYCIKFSKINTVYPIFKSIQLASRNKYEIDDSLIIGTIVDDIPERNFKALKIPSPFLNRMVLQRLLMQNWDKKNLFENAGDGTVRYIARENEFELSDGLGRLICISNDFLCLCRYMNKVTGLPSFTILTSEDTIRVIPENKENQPDSFQV
jgi:hypothetical protein